ncbi:MAG TPA: DUF2752 domain-containing protein [Candidatus Acidoferrales bacterium]|nr:DUF2752 domain-containing protein [Candidatus Acidoferrales bacterium]
MHRETVLKIAASAGLLAALVWVTVPAKPGFQLCGFHWLTGRPCPLCGLTRALFALAKGQWAAALHFNALSPLAFTMLFSLFWSGPMRGRLWTAGTAAFAAYGVVRVLFPETR